MRSGVYITCVLLLSCGCVHSNWPQLVKGSARGRHRTGSADGLAMVEHLVDDAKVPPKRPVALLRAQNDIDLDQPRISLTSSSATKTPLISHDPQTLSLIDQETRDFLPADRERAIAALNAIPSDSVPAVLKLWKAGLISPLGQSQNGIVMADAMSADGSSTSAVTADHSMPVNAGLGRTSPWGNSSTTNAFEGPVFPELESPGRPTRQINRVQRPTFGHSTPFRDPAINAAGSGMPKSPARLTSQPRMPEDWNPGRSDLSRTQTLPRTNSHDSMRTRAASATGTQPVRNYSSPFAESGERQVQIPPDWNGGTASASNSFHQASRSMPPDWNQHDASRVTSYKAAPYNDLSYQPIITPRVSGDRTVTEQDRPEPPVVQQTQFVDPRAEPSTSEITLSPGQPLPGFEKSVPPPTRWAGPNPGGPAIQGRGNQGSNPPSANDALQMLTKVTEAEVGRLGPGQSAEELQYYIERHVYLRLLYLMSGQTELALRPIPQVPPADQEFWTQVLWGVHSYFDLPQIPDHAERAAQTISQFNTAMLRLKERAPLQLMNVTFCHKIEGYGEYSTYPKDEFTPGQRVLIYAEIGNFHSELSAEGVYRTRLKSTLKFVDSNNPQEPVEVKTYPVTEDFCRNHRRDYFHSYVVDVPVRCTRGSYTLQLIIEDELSGKTATYQVPFSVR